MVQINESTVVHNLSVSTCYEAIDILAEALHQQGFVSSEYGKQTCLREEIHPTGLPTKPFCIAFPHADCDHVIKSALAVGILKDPVDFKNMGDPSEDLKVQVVFMLANSDPSEQIQTLRNLASLFGQGEKLLELLKQPTSQQTVVWLRNELQLD